MKNLEPFGFCIRKNRKVGVLNLHLYRRGSVEIEVKAAHQPHLPDNYQHQTMPASASVSAENWHWVMVWKQPVNRKNTSDWWAHVVHSFYCLWLWQRHKRKTQNKNVSWVCHNTWIWRWADCLSEEASIRPRPSLIPTKEKFHLCHLEWAQMRPPGRFDQHQSLFGVKAHLNFNLNRNGWHGEPKTGSKPK